MFVIPKIFNQNYAVFGESSANKLHLSSRIVYSQIGLPVQTSSRTLPLQGGGVQDGVIHRVNYLEIRIEFEDSWNNRAIT